MSAVASLTTLICCAGLGSGMLSLMIPQKRTKRILSFVLGLFLLVTVINGINAAVGELHLDGILSYNEDVLTESDRDYTGEVVQQTADTLVGLLDETLRDEGIAADDIRVSLKISSSGRISADRIDIYISEPFRGRKNDIRVIIRRELSKEPHIYVQGQEAE